MPKPEDISGRVFGRLTALALLPKRSKADKTLWVCKCECFNFSVATTGNLKNGSTQSCGCKFREDVAKRFRKHYDLTGIRYGRLVAVNVLVEMRKGRRKLFWLCQCDCGNTPTIPQDALVFAGTISCGCAKKRNPLVVGIARPQLPDSGGVINKLFSNYKRSARGRDKSFNLTKERCRELFDDNCAYCGIEPSQIFRSGLGQYLYNGIDRLDNSIGYEEGNVVTACHLCNYAKRDMTIDAFREWRQRLADHL
jgi:hypothetical protein